MKRRHSIITGAALLAAVALTGAPALAAGDNSPGMMQKSKDTVKETAREAKTEVTDSWVTSRAKIALFSDSRVKGRQITVETMKGVVTLRGKVDSDDAKTAAGEVVKGVDHVKGVKNDLQVVKPKERRSVDISDKDITARVEKRLTQDSGLKKITARTDAGVVTLTGEAPSLTASARASARLGDGPRGVRCAVGQERGAGPVQAGPFQDESPRLGQHEPPAFETSDRARAVLRGDEGGAGLAEAPRL